MLVRNDYSLKFKFVDLVKDSNFVGFESGVVCFFPSKADYSFVNDRHGCDREDFFKRHWPTEPVPKRYDPRCRPWYALQYENRETAVITDIYKYSTGLLGITTCLPLIMEKNVYRGAYCIDIIPTSQNSEFLQNYYNSGMALAGGKQLKRVDYILFN